jgi:MprA protease rhombosortase-interaction domain-containing protein
VKEKSKKRLFLFDILFTIFIFIWVVKAFIEGETSKGIVFSAMLLIMAGLLIFNRRKR